jgi:hypothetical protein
MNRWHLLHHVLPLEELATSGLKLFKKQTVEKLTSQARNTHELHWVLL